MAIVASPAGLPRDRGVVNGDRLGAPRMALSLLPGISSVSSSPPQREHR